MHPALQTCFTHLEKRKQTFMAVLEASTPEQHNFRPSPESWTMLEVAQHLLQAERGLAAPAYKGVELGRVTVRSRLGYWFVLGIFNTPFKVKIPEGARKGAEPKGGDALTLALIQQTWQDSRTQLQSYLENQPGSELPKPVTRHPLVDPMTLQQMLGFFDIHIAHHQHQLKRITQSSNFPTSKLPEQTAK